MDPCVARVYLLHQSPVSLVFVEHVRRLKALNSGYFGPRPGPVLRTGNQPCSSHTADKGLASHAADASAVRISALKRRIFDDFSRKFWSHGLR